MILSLMVSVLVLLKWTAHLVGGLADFLYQRGGVLRRSGGGGACGLHGTGFFVHGAPFLRAGLRRPAKQSVALTVHNVFRRLLGGPGVFLPEIFSRQRGSGRTVPGYGHRYGRGPGRRVLEFGQLQVGGDDHGPAAAVAAVNDENILLHRILGTLPLPHPKSSMMSRSYSSKLAIKSALSSENIPVRRFRMVESSSSAPAHPGQAGRWRYNRRKRTCRFPHPQTQQASVVSVCLLPVLHIGAGLVHQRILAVVVGKGVVVQIAVLQARGLPALDTLHARCRSSAALRCSSASRWHCRYSGA